MTRKLFALLLTLVLLLPLLPATLFVRAEGEVPSFYGASLTLENNLAINFAVDKDAFVSGGFSEPEVTFEFNGDSTVVTAPSSYRDGYYYFTYHDIYAMQMGDTVTATLSAVKDGVRVYGDPIEQSVALYCADLLDLYSDNATLRTLAVDLLTYGAKSQQYFGYNTGSLVTASLTPAQLAWGTSSDPVPVSIKNAAYATATDPEVTWYGSNLKLMESVDLQFFFIADDTSLLRIDVKDGSGNVLRSFHEEDMETVGAYRRVCLDTLTPDQMSQALYVAAYRDPGDISLPENELPFASLAAAPVSDTLRYSIESYAAEAIPDKNNAKLTALLYAMLNYGASTAAYVEDPGVRRVQSPMETPVYSFDHTPTTNELRAMAVQAFRDALTVQWYTDEDFTYTISNGQEFPINAAETYAGIPYTNAGSGLLQWLQYYDPATGHMTGLDSTVSGKLGNSCAAGVMWAWSSVVTSINWNTTYYMTPGRGCLPVGGYTVDPELMDYHDYTTTQIVEDNGDEAILYAYSQVQPADALISFMDEESAHARMVIEAPHVEYKANGAIDPANSYVVIQDQHKGQKLDTWSIVTEDGQTLHYAGHTSQQVTFQSLLNSNYIPVTAAEFTGAKAYDTPAARANYTGKITKLSNLQKVTVTSPYKIVTVKAVVRDGDTVIDESKVILGRHEISHGTISNYSLSSFPLPEGFDAMAQSGRTYTLTLEVLLASGTTHTVLTSKITKT